MYVLNELKEICTNRSLKLLYDHLLIDLFIRNQKLALDLLRTTNRTPDLAHSNSILIFFFSFLICFSVSH